LLPPAAGFGAPAFVTRSGTGGEFLDLKDIAFESETSVTFTEAAGNQSGTLTGTDGKRRRSRRHGIKW
jgi:hypothetical protein